MKILYKNNILNKTIEPSSELSNFPFGLAINDKRLSRFGKTSQNDLTILISDILGIAFTDVLVGNNNIVGTVKIQAHIDDDFTTPQFEASLTSDGINWSVANLTPTPIASELVDENGDYLVDESGDFITDYTLSDFKFIRLVVNSDAPIEFNKLFVGESIIMPGISPDCTLPITSNSEVEVNESGQIFTDRRIQLKSAGVSFPAVTETQRKEIIEFFGIVDITEPFWLMIWEDSLDVEPVLYATLTDSPSFKKAKGLLYSLNFNFREVK